jgi:hypothetical protein
VVLSVCDRGSPERSTRPTWADERQIYIYARARTHTRTHTQSGEFVSIACAKRLVLYREITAVYYKIHTKHKIHCMNKLQVLMLNPALPIYYPLGF